MTLVGKYFSHPFNPTTSSSPSWTFEGHFELIWRPSRALDSPLTAELQRNKDTVRCGALGAEVQGQRQEQLSKTFFFGGG